MKLSLVRSHLRARRRRLPRRAAEADSSHFTIRTSCAAEEVYGRAPSARPLDRGRQVDLLRVARAGNGLARRRTAVSHPRRGGREARADEPRAHGLGRPRSSRGELSPNEQWRVVDRTATCSSSIRSRSDVRRLTQTLAREANPHFYAGRLADRDLRARRQRVFGGSSWTAPSASSPTFAQRPGAARSADAAEGQARRRRWRWRSGSSLRQVAAADRDRSQDSPRERSRTRAPRTWSAQTTIWPARTRSELRVDQLSAQAAKSAVLITTIPAGDTTDERRRTFRTT